MVETIVSSSANVNVSGSFFSNPHWIRLEREK